MKFYDSKTAPSPRRVRIFIAEKGLDIETVDIDMRKGEQLSDEFRAINPNCTVPVLELDDGNRLLTTAGCPSSKHLGHVILFPKGGSGSSRFDVMPLGVDGSSGAFGWLFS